MVRVITTQVQLMIPTLAVALTLACLLLHLLRAAFQLSTPIRRARHKAGMLSTLRDAKMMKKLTKTLSEITKDQSDANE
jgi:hypothetical protein